jgi:hypothetical protein
MVQIKAIGSKFAPRQGVIAFPYMYIVKSLKTFFKKRNSKSLNIWHETLSDECLPTLFICSNKYHGVKIGQAPGGSLIFLIGI